jgi:hypothetical protein
MKMEEKSNAKPAESTHLRTKSKVHFHILCSFSLLVSNCYDVAMNGKQINII